MLAVSSNFEFSSYLLFFHFKMLFGFDVMFPLSFYCTCPSQFDLNCPLDYDCKFPLNFDFGCVIKCRNLMFCFTSVANIVSDFDSTCPLNFDWEVH